MTEKRAIITIVNSLSPTSMDFHEFVLYRSRIYPEEMNYFLVLGPVPEEIMRQCQKKAAGLDIKIFDCNGSCRLYLERFGEIAAELRAKKIPTLMHVHMGRSGAIALLKNAFNKRSMRVPALYTVHNTRKWATWRSELLLPINILLADEVAVVSKYAFKSVPGIWRFLKKGHIRPLQNGSNIEWIEDVISQIESSRLNNDLISEEITLLSVCRLSEAKNLHFLIKLIPLLPQKFRLRLVGDGTLRGELESLVEELQVGSRVEFVGLLPREKVFEEMFNADLFVSSSFWEGLPISVIESMAAKMPVILSDIGPHKEIAEYGSSVSILPLDPQKWIDEIERFTNMTMEDKENIGVGNSRIIKEQFSLERMHSEYTCLYDRLWDMSKKRLEKK